MNTNEIREKLKNVRCFMLDMDGTIYLGDSLFPFTKDFLDAVVKSGREFCFFTNNSSKDTDTYLQKLSRMGIDIPREKMLISNGVAADYVLENHPGAKVFVLGTPLLRRELTNFGVNVVEDDPDVVLVGFDTTLEYNRLAKACDFIRAGLPTYGLNPDYNCPTETGFIPDCGSIAMLIEGSTGRTFPFFGKPSPLTRAYIAKQTGYEESELAIIGDRLYTDIALADNSPMCSILVLSGESKVEDIGTMPGDPDLIFKDLSEIIPHL